MRVGLEFWDEAVGEQEVAAGAGAIGNEHLQVGFCQLSGVAMVPMCTGIRANC